MEQEKKEDLKSDTLQEKKADSGVLEQTDQKIDLSVSENQQKKVAGETEEKDIKPSRGGELKRSPRQNSPDYDKYDKQAQNLKKLNYSKQQIIDNLFRLNPELNDNKHMAAQIVNKYFPEEKPLTPSSGNAQIQYGRIELTEEIKSFIESLLRRQLDAFRNVIEEEKVKKCSFGDSFTSKILEWGPIFITLQILFTFGFLLYKGGFQCLKMVIYGPVVTSQILLYPLGLLTIGIILFLFYARDNFYDDHMLNISKLSIYLLLPILIISAQTVAIERYKNQSNWDNFLNISDKNFFIARWYETDYKDRQIFLDRANKFIIFSDINDTYGATEFSDVTRALIYTGHKFFNSDFQEIYPDIKRQIIIYNSVLLYDESVTNREKAINSLVDILKETRKNMSAFEENFRNIQNCLQARQQQPDMSNMRLYEITANTIENLNDKITDPQKLNSLKTLKGKFSKEILSKNLSDLKFTDEEIKTIEDLAERTERQSIFMSSSRSLMCFMKIMAQESESLIIDTLQNTAGHDPAKNIRILSINSLGEVGNAKSAVFLRELLGNEKDIQIQRAIMLSLQKVIHP